ncbi:ribonuclease PH [Alienimonas chondri]|uniref:Ribonuclease PH n=1 Tax=Alienimonas chondri TaxID=2681879 RepID=A0ABX1VEB6_9PLAN|nr:ribonuclease PH [Alienimonas chondri]NNJ25381.1 Ribonuclease PH [Alienimonas chondri]
MPRPSGREPGQLRELTVQRPFPSAAAGSVLISAGDTVLLCTASVTEGVPPWRVNRDDPARSKGWVTAEYAMHPGSTPGRKKRGPDGRATEIQRLIGRSLRAAVDFAALGNRTITVDCDVMQADGGTRTLAITGGFIALADAVASLDLDRPSNGVPGVKVLTRSIAAVSVGVTAEGCVLDLDYAEDSRAEVDLNVVMTGGTTAPEGDTPGDYIEVQGTAEGEPFPRPVLNELLDLAAAGCVGLTAMQRELLGDRFPG